MKLSRPTVWALWPDCMKMDILHWILFCNTAVVVFSLNALVISYTRSPKCGAMGKIDLAKVVVFQETKW